MFVLVSRFRCLSLTLVYTFSNRSTICCTEIFLPCILISPCLWSVPETPQGIPQWVVYNWLFNQFFKCCRLCDLTFLSDLVWIFEKNVLVFYSSFPVWGGFLLLSLWCAVSRALWVFIEDGSTVLDVIRWGYFCF